MLGPALERAMRWLLILTLACGRGGGVPCPVYATDANKSERNKGCEPVRR